MQRPSLALLLVLCLAPCVAGGFTRVNVCHSDTGGGGPGTTNLSSALAVEGDISIECPAGSVLRVSSSYNVSRNVSIDGRGVTLLIDTAALPTFAIGAGARLRMRELTLTSTGPVPSGRSPGLATFLVGRRGTLELEAVTARGLARPAFVMEDGRAVLFRSRFEHGVDPIRVDGGRVEIHAKTAFEYWDTALQIHRGSTSISGATFRRSRLVMDRCTFTIADSEFLDSDVRSKVLPGGAIDTDCDGRIDRSLFVNNHAIDGGAINLRNGMADVRLFRVRFFHNSATRTGGAIHRHKFLLVRGSRAPPLSLGYCVFRANHAENGGGVYLPSGVVEARAVHFANNIARHTGGGIYARAFRMSRGTLVGNSAAVQGGGMYSLVDGHPFRGLVTNVVANSLVVKNSAPEGAGIYGSAMRVVNSTIADNIGSGISGGAARVRPAITLTNTLVTRNSGGECAPPSGSDGEIVANGPNLQFPSSSCPGITVADPTLDPLYSPVVGSPALAAADLNVCKSDPVSARDVFGEPRPQGKGCTIGAVENAVDRLVFSRLLRDRHEFPAQLIDRIRETARRVWGDGTQ
jgi:predicted outer membrane repeat protein